MLQIVIVAVVVVLIFGGASSAQETPGRGAVPPKNLPSVVTRQTEVLKVQKQLLKNAPRAFVVKPRCDASMPKFDWRDSGKVSEVQHQGSCGSCWAFAAHAAYESSYLIENNLKAGPTTVNSSEQQALDCSWPAYSCDGGWHDKVFEYLAAPGGNTEADYAYAGRKGQCKLFDKSPYSAVTWGFVKGDTIPSDTELKSAICEHGPVVAAVLAKRWEERLPGSGFFVYSTKNPNWRSTFPDGVYNKGVTSTKDLTMNTMNGDVDHDVLIVGWNEKGWIVKNSWGKDWGDGGYIKIPYGTSNVGFNAAWVQAQQTRAPLPSALKEAVGSVSRNFKLEDVPNK